MPKNTLQDVLQRVGRRLIAIGVTAGIAWGLAAAVVLLLTGVWLDLLWELPAHYRIACIVVSTLLGAALLAFLGRLAWRQRAPRALAKRLDQAAESGGQVLSGVDLFLETPRSSPLSTGLAEMAVVHAGQVASRVPGSKAVPVKPLSWSFGSLILLVGGVALGCLLMPRLAWTQWLRFSDPYGDHA